MTEEINNQEEVLEQTEQEQELVGESRAGCRRNCRRRED